MLITETIRRNLIFSQLYREAVFRTLQTYMYVLYQKNNQYSGYNTLNSFGGQYLMLYRKSSINVTLYHWETFLDNYEHRLLFATFQQPPVLLVQLFLYTAMGLHSSNHLCYSCNSSCTQQWDYIPATTCVTRATLLVHSDGIELETWELSPA